MKNHFATVLLIFIFSNVCAQKSNYNLLIGTYTQKCENKGIYAYDFNTKTGDFSFKNSTENVVNPSFLTVSKDNTFVYSVNELGPESTISSFGYNATTGKLDVINKQNSKGADPCYIINDHKNVIVANYSGGSISVFTKNIDGSLAEAKQVLQHFGKGSNTQRQKSPHVHMVYFSPDKKFVLATDLGNDKIYVYSYFPEEVNTVLKLKDSISVQSGSGPRHLTFSNDGKFVYLLQELNGAITVFGYANGMLKKNAGNYHSSKRFQRNF